MPCKLPKKKFHRKATLARIPLENLQNNLKRQNWLRRAQMLPKPPQTVQTWLNTTTSVCCAKLRSKMSIRLSDCTTKCSTVRFAPKSPLNAPCVLTQRNTGIHLAITRNWLTHGQLRALSTCKLFSSVLCVKTSTSKAKMNSCSISMKCTVVNSIFGIDCFLGKFKESYQRYE